MIPSIRHIAVAILAATTQFTVASADITQTYAPVVRAADSTSTVTFAASLPSNAPEYASDSLFQSAILNSTNFFRSEHNATAVTWNKTIAAFADEYLANDTDCTFAHSGGPYGENIAVGFLSVHGAIDAFGLERDEYNYNDPGFSEATGHFTQLVWKATRTVGCGRKLCGGKSAGQKSTGWFLVCEYWPRGNVIGQFAQEVGRQVSGMGADGSGSGSGGGGVGSGPGDEPSEAAGRPSLGGIAAALVVFVMIAAAFVNDVRLTIADP